MILDKTTHIIHAINESLPNKEEVSGGRKHLGRDKKKHELQQCLMSTATKPITNCRHYILKNLQQTHQNQKREHQATHILWEGAVRNIPEN